MWTTESIHDLRLRRRELSGTVAFVPTMGALHAGHVSLIHAAKQLADHVLVSIYVNPTQFGPSEDLSKYPRTLKDDLAHCEAAGAAGAFCPDNMTMYPQQIACELTVPQLVTMLEGEHRQGHFAGVCRVVAKLFNMVQPDVACFGRKDYQQLKVIETMTNDLAMPIRIVGCPTVREQDGLAMSSRNRYLTPETRKRGIGLYKALSEARAMVEEHGETDPTAVEAAMHTVLVSHKVAVDYAVLRHPQTLAAFDCIEPALTGGVVALVAGRVDEVRLIDNMILAEQ